MLDNVDPSALPVAAAHPRRDVAKPRKRGAFRVAVRTIAQAVLAIAILVGAGLVTQRIIQDKPEAKRRPAFTPSYTIATVEAARADHRPVFTAYGQIVAARSVDLRALVAGEIISISPNLQAGASVDAGEPLVEIDRFQYEGAVAEAKSGLLEAEARIAENEARIAAEGAKQATMQEQLDLAQADLERIQNLRRRKQGTQQQVEARQLIVSQRQQTLDLSAETVKIEDARLAQQRAGLGRLEWALQRAERNLESTMLKAPFDGTVSASAAEVGRLVSANDVVVSLYDSAALEARFTLNDARYGRLQASAEPLIGREVAVIWSVGGSTITYPATITRLGAEITSSRGGVEVYARLKSTDGALAIRPGAFVEISVPDVAYPNTIALPDTALFGTDTVYVNDDGELAERKVEIAAFDEDRFLVSGGLEPGERVLTTRITEVSAGLKVVEEGAEPTEPPTSRAPGGRPSREEIASIIKANGLSRETFRALPQSERRAMIASFREGKGEDRAPAGESDR